MQPSPVGTTLPSSGRTRAFTFVLMGGLLILTGSVLSYTWTLMYAFTLQGFALDSPLSVAATTVSALGGILRAGGFLLAFYGIALVLDALYAGRLPLSPGSDNPSLVRSSSPSDPGVRARPSLRIMEGAGLVFVGGVVGTLSQFIPLFSPTFGFFQWQIGVSVIGAVIGAAGFLLAFIGVVSTLSRAR